MPTTDQHRKPADMDDQELEFEWLRLTAEHANTYSDTKRRILKFKIDRILDVKLERLTAEPVGATPATGTPTA